MSLSITACTIKKNATTKGEMINVFLVFNDTFYCKGTVKKTQEGKEFLVLANAPWKNDQTQKWNNNYLAGLVSDDIKTKVEAFVLNQVKIGKDWIEPDPQKRVNYDIMQAKFSKKTTDGNNGAGTPNNFFA